MFRYGLTTPGHVPPREFAALRRQCRNRRKLVADRARVCNRLGKTLDHDGPRLGGVLTDPAGAQRRRILDSLVAVRSPDRIFKGLTHHPRGQQKPLAAMLAARL